jgi:hypothetical protein
LELSDPGRLFDGCQRFGHLLRRLGLQRDRRVEFKSRAGRLR